MGVFHAETGQEDFRVAIRDVVMVAVGIKEQIRRLRYEHAPLPNGKSVARFKSSKLMNLSALPSPSVSSQMVILSAPWGHAEGSGMRRTWFADIDRPGPASNQPALDIEDIG